MDADGYLTFIDRMKDAIRRRGENISSWEVEQVVNAHADVLECAAYGVPSELSEEEVAIAIVLQPGRTLDPDALIAHCEAADGALRRPALRPRAGRAAAHTRASACRSTSCATPA